MVLTGVEERSDTQGGSGTGAETEKVKVTVSEENYLRPIIAYSIRVVSIHGI